jgi:hypothetical protein
MRSISTGLLLGYAAAASAKLNFEHGGSGAPITLTGETAQTLNLACDGNTENLCAMESRMQTYVDLKIEELKNWTLNLMPASCQTTGAALDSDGFTLGANIDTDLGTDWYHSHAALLSCYTCAQFLLVVLCSFPRNGFTYDTDNCPQTGADYGINLSMQGLDEKTVFKLKCTESSDGQEQVMYLAGLKNGGQDAFQASQQTDFSTVVCSSSADLSNPTFGSACVHGHAQGTHTYWTHGTAEWALYASGTPATLRHCTKGVWDGVQDKGSIWFKKSTQAIPAQ